MNLPPHNPQATFVTEMHGVGIYHDPDYKSWLSVWSTENAAALKYHFAVPNEKAASGYSIYKLPSLDPAYWSSNLAGALSTAREFRVYPRHLQEIIAFCNGHANLLS